MGVKSMKYKLTDVVTLYLCLYRCVSWMRPGG
jgi:hypothetical protein